MPLLLAACATSGRQLDPSVLRQLSTAHTQAEVRALFGQPKESVRASNGNQLDVFAAFPAVDISPHRHFAEVEVRTLHVLYDPAGKVLKHTSHTGIMKVVGDLWMGREIPANVLDGLERDVMNRDDLIASFGPATVEGFDVHGRPTMRWIFLEGRKYATRQGRELIVLLDDKGVLRNYRLLEADH